MKNIPFLLDKQEKYSFQELTDIIAALRGPEGCSWDREQTVSSMKHYLENETNEVYHAIDSQDMENLCEELGDVLFQILLISQIAKDNGNFDITDVIDTISRKMIRRHPHVFSDVTISSKEEGMKLWEEIKKEEKKLKKCKL